MHIALQLPAAVRDFSPLERFAGVVRVLAARNLKGRYRGSILGVYWSLGNPLFMTAIYTAIFGAAFAKYYHNNTWDYVLACFSGLAVLNFFAQTTAQALPSLVSNGALVNKLPLPLSAFPVSVVAANLFQFAVGTFPVLAIVTLVLTRDLTHVLWMIVPSIALLMVTTGFSLVLATLYVFFRDLAYLYELFTFGIWMTTPIFYPADVVPERLRVIFAFNPLSSIITSVRSIAFDPARPSLHLLGLSLLVGVVVLLAGAGVFRWQQHAFMDLI
uniref:Teichoic acid translocation permease protein TagG n=1 Tax=uncultured organism TaxID=155900 RepID=A0A7L9QC01_9ZZZZ|nr:teichoic acid translocation permease protein TagG [uncultured organism]